MSQAAALTGKNTQAVGFATSTSTSTTMSTSMKAARESLAGLQTAEAGTEGSGVVTKAMAAALTSLTMMNALPAHAESVSVAAPTSQGLFLDGEQLQATRFGAVGNHQKLLGLDGAVHLDVKARGHAAFQAFETRLLQILQADLGSRAAGLQPLQSSALTEVQTDQLKAAFKDLLAQMPIGAFSPEVQNVLQAALGAAGDHRNLSSLTLKEFGKVGGDAAAKLVKDAVKDLKNDHPAAFWSLASAGAAAALAVGYTQGSEALAKVGIKPELKTNLFGDVRAKVGVLTGPKLSDPRLTLGLDGRHTFDNGTTVHGGLSAELAGKTLTAGSATVGVSTQSGFTLDGQMRFDGSGKPFDARLSASQQIKHDDGHGLLYGHANWSNGTHGTAEVANATLGYAGTHGRWTTSVAGSYDFKSATFTSSLAAGRTFDVQRKNDLELQIRGSVTNRGDAFIGAAVRLNF